MSWQNRVLDVDLGRRRIEVLPLRRDWAGRYIGQRGLASKYLFENMPPTADPLGPDNLLIFATGPLTATSASTSSRYSVVTKGPLTGTIACSNSGGRFGAELKLAGYDLLLIRGRASQPLYLYIHDDDVRLLDGSAFWGRDVWDTEAGLRLAHADPDLEVAAVGRAGEVGVRYACIVNDRDRAAGRTGVGAVMGAKQLKAVAVRGTRGLAPADPVAFAAAVRLSNARIAASPGRKRYARNGTQAMMGFIQAFGGLPTRNFQAVQFEGANRVDAAAMWKTGPDGHRNMVRNGACFGCTIACQRISRVNPRHWTVRDKPRYQGAGGGLEYETAFALGPLLGIDDLDALTYAGFLTNQHGLDPISFGGSLAAAMELYTAGVIDAGETDGVELRFGNAEALCRMVEATGLGQGFGRVLGLGARALGERYGHPEVAMHVKGQEFAGYDPRAMQGMGLGYATGNRGACHMKHDVFTEDIRDPGPQAKAEPCVRSQNEIAVIDSTGLCVFPTGAGWTLEDYRTLLNAACATQWSIDELRTAGERIWTLERLFNQRAGFTAADDTLPARLLGQPAPGGTMAGRVCELQPMLAEYYRLRGWNPDGSLPQALIQRLEL